MGGVGNKNFRGGRNFAEYLLFQEGFGLLDQLDQLWLSAQT